MTREEMLACLNDRPCDVCKFHTEKGCERWNCIFEEEPDDAENDVDTMLNKIKEKVKNLQGENFYVGFNTCKNRVLDILDNMRGDT